MSGSPNSQISAEDIIREAQRLLKVGQFEAVIQLLDDSDGSTNNPQEALYLRAVSQRYTKRHQDAIKTLQQLLEIAPEYGRAYQELGHNYRAMGEAKAALDAFQRAVQSNPGLQASWQQLSALAAQLGQTDLADNARRNYERLVGLPRELVSVTSMMHEGRLLKAERLCRNYLQSNPHHPEAMRLLAQLGMRLGVLDDAEFLLESCLEFNPENIYAHFDYVEVLHKRQKYQQALEEAEKLRSKQPGNPSFESAWANACMAVGKYDEALNAYEALLKKLPDNENIHLMRGHAFKTIGRQDDAIQSYQSAIKAREAFGDPYWSLANLKTFQFDAATIARMQAVMEQPGVSTQDQYHLAFALGKAFEDSGQAENAFQYYAEGNALKKAELRYDGQRMHDEMAEQKQVFTQQLLDSAKPSGHPAPDPIFIVGLPRAGSTLLEQILASHSQVDGTFELPNILATAHRLNGRRRVNEPARYPKIVAELSDEQLHELGAQYMESTQVHRQGAPFFLDKMPNNFRHIGLIHRILPNARIIDARRHPMACCFSGYKQLFAEGQEFTYSLQDIGNYCRDYVDLMDHWEQVLPGKVLRVRYENVVADLETQVRRILDYLKLDFESECLEFHRTDRSVRTASSEQVRQPIYQSGLEQWRTFEPWLGPLKQALGDALPEGTDN